MFTLYVDADSLPKTHRAIILKRILKDNISAFFVADRELPDVKDAIAADTAAKRDPYRDLVSKEDLKRIKSNISMIVVDSGDNSADDEIVRIATPPALAITHDIPLASRLLGKGILVIDDRGREFTNDNIRELLSLRDINNDLREYGLGFDKSERFKQGTIDKFANCFDSIIQRFK